MQEKYGLGTRLQRQRPGAPLSNLAGLSWVILCRLPALSDLLCGRFSSFLKLKCHIEVFLGTSDCIWATDVMNDFDGLTLTFSAGSIWINLGVLKSINRGLKFGFGYPSHSAVHHPHFPLKLQCRLLIKWLWAGLIFKSLYQKKQSRTGLNIRKTNGWLILTLISSDAGKNKQKKHLFPPKFSCKAQIRYFWGKWEIVIFLLCCVICGTVSFWLSCIQKTKTS